MISDELFELIVKLIQQRKGFEELDEEALRPSIERAVAKASQFCRLRVLPSDMKYVLADMAKDFYEMVHGLQGIPDQSQSPTMQGITKLTQGDTTVEYDATLVQKPLATDTEVISKYFSELAPYRSIFWK